MVALLAGGCGKREEQAAKVGPSAKVGLSARAGSSAEDVGAEIVALRATMEEREDAGEHAAAAAAGDKLITLLRAEKLTAESSFPETLERYGRVLLAAGRWNEVELIIKEALALPRGKTDPVLRSALLFDLGGIYSEERRNEEAITALTESLELSEKAHGRDSYATANTVESLASVYDYAGRFEEAEVLFRRSLVITETEHGATSPQAGRVLTNLALNLAFQKRFADAEAMYRRAIPILEPLRGYDRSSLAQVYAGLGEIYRERDKLALAEASYRSALAERIEALGGEHPLVAMDNYNLAIVLEDQNKLTPAIEACAKSEALRATALAADHPHRIQTEEACARMRASAARPLRKQRKPRK